MARRQNPEQHIQRAVIQHLKQRGAPGVVYIHVPNGGKRRPIEAAIMKGLGVRAGAPDLLLWHNQKSFAIEIKALGGRATLSQLEMLADLEREGVYCCKCEGLDRTLATLESWGLLMGTAQ